MGILCGISGETQAEAGQAMRRMADSAPQPQAPLRVIRLGTVSLGCTESEWPVQSGVVESENRAGAFLGMFDNLESIARDLDMPGSEVAGRDPASVLLEMFRRYGTDTPRRIRGMFSGVITDGKQVWMFRDQVGFWPLFYRWDRRRLVFATHARQVTAGASLRNEPDIEVVERGFFRSLGNDPHCALQGVERLAPATLATCDGYSLVHQPYWQPETLLEKGGVAASEVRERFDELMQQAVDRTLKGDDVVSLSGGIDSPAVAGYAAPISKRRFGHALSALSVVYPQHPSVDESGLIAEVADYLGMPYHLYRTEAKAMARFQEIMEGLDGPFPMSSLSERLSHLEKARSLGFRNMLTGELAEYLIDMRDHVLSHLLSRGRWKATAAHVHGLAAGGLTPRQILRRSITSITPASILDLTRRSKERPPVSPVPPEWLKVDAFPHPTEHPVRQRWRADQLAAFGGPGLAFEAEYAIQSMTGVWIRLPWADIDLWEFFLGLRAEIKYPDPWRKTLVRDLIEGKVPDSIRNRTTRTFFDASMMENIDYGTLRSWLVDPQFQLDGVDYTTLKDQLESESLTLPASMWAKDLVAVHSFMARF